MKDYQSVLDRYAFPKTYARSETYLKSFWLTHSQYVSRIQAMRCAIFKEGVFTPDAFAFNENFNSYETVGGVLFVKDDYVQLQQCLTKTEDKTIFVIEDFDTANPPHTSGPPFRMQYPKASTWQVIYPDEEGISYELFGRPVRNYFVFGDSGLWGKYAGSDWQDPVDIWAFSPEVEDVFLEGLEGLHLKSNR
jgi:hypothetical protein